MGRSGSRKRINSCGDLEMRNRLFPLEIAKQLKNYEESVAKETDRARQLRIDELALQQEKNPTTESRLLTQVQDLQKRVNSLTVVREFFMILRQRAVLERPTSPANPLPIPSARTAYCRDSGLPHDPRNTMGTSGNGFESPPAREGPSAAFFANPKNLASSSCGLGQGAEINNTKSRFSQGIVTLNPFVSYWRN